MRRNTLPAFLALIFVAACSRPVHVYPVAGPRAEAWRGEPIKGRVSGLLSGRVTLHFPEEGDYSGAWSLVPQDTLRGGEEQAWASAWDTVYGKGYFQAHVLGAAFRARAALQSGPGAKLAVEFYRVEGRDTPVLGVAHDPAGNVYKLTL